MVPVNKWNVVYQVTDTEGGFGQSNMVLESSTEHTASIACRMHLAKEANVQTVEILSANPIREGEAA